MRRSRATAWRWTTCASACTCCTTWRRNSARAATASASSFAWPCPFENITPMEAVNLPLRVLIVDDEELARTRLKTLVAECAEPRARVVGEAASSALALGWLEHNSCDVLLLDIQMPGADGRQLSRLLRQRFLRVHRNALVARHAVRALERRPSTDGDDEGGEGWAVQVAPLGEWLAVSRRQLTAVREALAAEGL